MPLTTIPSPEPLPDPALEARKVEVPLDQIFQPDRGTGPAPRRRPLLSLEIVVSRTIALSALAVAVFTALALLALWVR